MTRCRVQGCIATIDTPYSGSPACMQGFGGTPELAAAVFKDCLLRSTDQLLPDRLNGMDTAPEITDEEIVEHVARAIDPFVWSDECRESSVMPHMDEMFRKASIVKARAAIHAASINVREREVMAGEIGDKISHAEERALLLVCQREIASLRAVASRTRQATPAPDAMAEAEAMEALKELYTHCFCTPGPYEPPSYAVFLRTSAALTKYGLARHTGEK